MDAINIEVRLYDVLFTPKIPGENGGNWLDEVHYTTLHYITLHYTTLHQLNPNSEIVKKNAVIGDIT